MAISTYCYKGFCITCYNLLLALATLIVVAVVAVAVVVVVVAVVAVAVVVVGQTPVEARLLRGRTP